MVLRAIALILSLTVMVACDDDQRRARERAEREERAIREGVEELVRREREERERQAGILADQVMSGIDSAEAQLAVALATGRKVSAELDKVYRTDTDYELAVSEEADPDSAAHAERLAQMPTVSIGDVTVGYEEDATRSLRGVRYAKHFRATWRRDGELVRVSYFTQEEIDAVGFARLLQKMVPIVENALR